MTNNRRDDKGRFPPGVSGNPRGNVENLEGRRTGKPSPMKELARLHGEEAIEKAVAIMRDETQPGSVRLQAANLILDRAWGRPPVQHEVSGEIQHSLVSYLRALEGGS